MPEHETPVGVIVGATLGLLAFVLAFTFSQAFSRYEVRKVSQQALIDMQSSMNPPSPAK